MAIFTLTGTEVTHQTDFTLTSQRPLDRLRLLRDQGVNTLICGGIQDRFEDMVRASGIRVISWVSGAVYDLLAAHIEGRLKAGTRLPEGPTSPAPRRSDSHPEVSDS